MAGKRKRRKRGMFYDGLSDNDIARYDDFIAYQAERVLLPKKEKAVVLQDLSNLFAFYLGKGFSMQAAIEHIGVDILGTFYQPATADEWYPLDSAAKVYPLSMSQRSMSIFRVSAYLKSPVEPAVLQIALLSTMKRFPIFATTIRQGFFWHYVDATRRRFVASVEKTMPCQPMNVSGRRAPSFRVQYYGHRISLEIFHILTDGTGAMVFLQSLAREYLRLLGDEIPLSGGMLDVSGQADIAEMRNDFSLGTPVEKSGGFMGKMAAQLRGKRTALQPARVLHFIMPADKLLEVARSREATVTGLLLTLIFLACSENLTGGKPESRIQIQVPVNMRKFYPSGTLRNFSMYDVLQVTKAECTTLDAALPIVTARLREGTRKEKLDEMVQMTNKLVKNPFLRFAPLVVKRAILRIGYRTIGERSITTTFSNLGVVKGAYGDLVDMFDFVLGPSSTNNANCALATYGSKAVFTVTRSTLDTGFEDALYTQLDALGIPIAAKEARL